MANELNNDYGSLFAEKKYKELLVFAKEQQSEQLAVFALQVAQLRYTVSELAQLSETRKKLIQHGVTSDGVMTSSEEHKGGDDIASTFSALASDLISQAYLHELKTAFLKNRAAEAELKTPKADGGAD